jgi:bifunctional non-homologous end joining protein LigD
MEDRLPIAPSHELNGEGTDFFAAADASGSKGRVQAKGTRPLAGETDHWLKVKCWSVGEFDVIGVKKGDDGLPYTRFASDGQRSAPLSSR